MNRIVSYLIGLTIIFIAMEYSGVWSSLSNLISNNSNDQQLCITPDGQVYYGAIPNGTKCEVKKSVTTSVNVIESRTQQNSFTRQQNYRCDGRTHCSQMTSCQEAIFFLNNCPNPKMDGDYDGIPCEKQWCGN